LKGHNKFITALSVDRQNGSLFSGSYDSVVTKWNIDSGENDTINGSGHKNQISGLAVDGGNIVAGSMDDSISISAINTNQYGNSIGVDAPVVGVDSRNGTVVTATISSVYAIAGGNVSSTVAAGWGPQSVAISPDASEVAVGGGDNKIHIFSLAGGRLTEKTVYEAHRGPVSAIQYSPDGKYIGSGGKDRYVYVWDRSTGKSIVEGWIFHTSTVNSLAWNPDSTRLATGSLDQNIIVWNIATPNKHIDVKGAHRGGTNVVDWLNGNTLVSAGQDCSIKTWTIQ